LDGRSDKRESYVVRTIADQPDDAAERQKILKIFSKIKTPLASSGVHWF